MKTNVNKKEKNLNRIGIILISPKKTKQKLSMPDKIKRIKMILDFNKISKNIKNV